VKTSTQLKAKARNLSAKTNIPSHIIQRNYFLERFLERVSLSRYKDSIILKGGVLITSLLGIEERATVDLDATMMARSLTEPEIKEILAEVLQIDLHDSVVFSYKDTEETRIEADYPGFRVTLNVKLDKLRDTIKIDFTAGDVITPNPVEYGYRLMFEDREIRVLAYNLETILAEKFNSVLSLSVVNTRMKDYYDIHMLITQHGNSIDKSVFAEALKNTAKQRNTFALVPQAESIVSTIAENSATAELWKRYQTANKYASGIDFITVTASLQFLSRWCNPKK